MATVAVLLTRLLPTDTSSILDSSSADSGSSHVASPSSAATSFDLPIKSEAISIVPSTPITSLVPRSPVIAKSSQPTLTATTALPPSRYLSFTSLPADIHHLILTEHLPYDSIVALRSTSSYFHSLISAWTLRRLRQNVIRRLLDDERQLLKKWVPHTYSRYNGRPSTQMTCYSCLQSLPVTDFFLSQVSHNKGLGRKRAGERWCKPCGLKFGKIRQGRWIEEVSYGPDDRYRYETVMSNELKVENPCLKCPAKHRYDGQPVWWGCLDCFEKEEARLRKQDSERRRDVRRYCSRAKHGVQALMNPSNIADIGREAGWWVKNQMSWGGIVSRSYRVIWWFTDDPPWSRMCRTCQRASSWLESTLVRESGGRLGRKAKGAVDNMLGLATKRGTCGTDATIQVSDDCVVCSGALLEPPTDKTTAETEIREDSRSSIHTHVCVPSPRREVRCWRCWRARRSRRRRRHDNGLAYGLPLPQDRWCDGCQAEHHRFIELKRDKKVRQDKERAKMMAARSAAKSRNGDKEWQEVDVSLARLFAEV